MADLVFKNCCGAAPECHKYGGFVLINCPVCGHSSLPMPIVDRRTGWIFLDPESAKHAAAVWNQEVDENERRKKADGCEPCQEGEALDKGGD